MSGKGMLFLRATGLLALGMALVSPAWGQVAVSVSPAQRNATPGVQFTVEVTVGAVTGLKSAKVVFTFDDAIIQYVTAVKGPICSDLIFARNPSTGGPGINSVEINQSTSAVAGSNGPGVLFTITFEATLQAGSSPVTLSEVDLRDPTNTPIAATATSGVVRNRAPVYVSPANQTIPIPDPVIVSINVSNVVDLHSAFVHVAFDRSRMQLQTTSNAGSILSSNGDDVFMYNQVTSGPSFDTVKVDQAILGPGGVSGAGSLFRLTFNPLLTGTTPITITYAELGDTDPSVIPSLAQSGSVLIDEPVPVQLVSLTGIRYADRYVLLEWKTLSEVNNYGFEVQKSPDGGPDYVTLPGSFVAGSGTTTLAHTYRYVDSSAAPGIWYYRLKQIDLGGATYFTEGVRVEVVTSALEQGPLTFTLNQNYPNPFNPATTISFSLPHSASVTLQVFNTLGEKVAELVNEKVGGGRHDVQFDASHLASGLYFYTIVARESEGNTLVDTRKMVLVR